MQQVATLKIVCDREHVRGLVQHAVAAARATDYSGTAIAGNCSDLDERSSVNSRPYGTSCPTGSGPWAGATILRGAPQMKRCH